MAGAPSDIAVQNANLVMQACQAIRNMHAGQSQFSVPLVSIQDLIIVNTNNPMGTGWALLNTCAVAADGQLGAADGSPNSGHPIDTRVYPLLSRAVSSTQLGQALQVLVDFNTFANGGSLSANASRPAQIDAVAF